MTGTTDRAAPAPCEAEWWRQAAVYQIYPRSFVDSGAGAGAGHGLGDLRGIIDRIPYLRSLGIDAIWLSPFYPSALADGGYDIDDPRAVDPRLGTLGDVDDLVAAAHEAGLKLIVDVVPNHTSDRHQWFRSALEAGRGSAERSRYIFREGQGGNGNEAPTDWLSEFGGPSWTQVEDGQWYLHTHAREQPDLNWDHPEVREDALQTLRFWADRGVDGFRVDVAHQLSKDLSADPLPTQEQMKTKGFFDDGTHPTKDRDELVDIYRQWRKVLNEYDPPKSAIAEAWVPAHRRVRYASPETLGQAFNFDLLRAGWDADEFREIIRANITLAREAGSSSTWVLSNHDVVRHRTRYGLGRHDNGKEWLARGGPAGAEDRKTGLARARAATLLIMALPGSTYIYQGEELGLPEVAEIPDRRRQDPTFQRTGGRDVGRDGCRVPLPWVADQPYFGFGTAEPHLPQPDWFTDFAVDIQDHDEGSTLNLYRRALNLRKRLREEATDDGLEWLTADAPVVSFRRSNGWSSHTNLGATPVDGPESVILSSDLSAPYDGMIAPDTTVWSLGE